MKRNDDEVWTLVHAERRALAADLATLTDEQWNTPSLSRGWTVWDVAAHLVGNADFRWRDLLGGMVRHRFDFDAMNDADMASRRGATPADTLASLRAVIDLRSSPPAALPGRLVEEVAHGEDIRRPLGLVRHYPLAAVVPALEYQLSAPDAFGGARRRLARVRLEATDAHFAHGRGPLVQGPALELLLLASGRGAHARELVGDVDHLLG